MVRVCEGFAYYYLTSIIAVGGLLLGVEHMATSPTGDEFDPPGRVDFGAAFFTGDGKWFSRIAREGYFYDPHRLSSVAMFPAYPLVGRAAAAVSGLPPGVALVVLSQIFLFVTLILLIDYVRRRSPCGPADLPGYVALALALCPVGFFFRVAYSESMFLLLVLLAMHGMLRRWPVAVVAGIIGLATGTRAVGVALIPPLILSVWRWHPTPARRAAVLAYAIPLSCCGLIGYMAYQGYEFGDPLVFVRAQNGWQFRPDVPPERHLQAVATLEPIWSAYDPGSPGYWGNFDPILTPPFNVQSVTPLYVLGSAGLVAVGAWRRWLTPVEVLLAASLLAAPVRHPRLLLLHGGPSPVLVGGRSGVHRCGAVVGTSAAPGSGGDAGDQWCLHDRLRRPVRRPVPHHLKRYQKVPGS